MTHIPDDASLYEICHTPNDTEIIKNLTSKNELQAELIVNLEDQINNYKNEIKKQEKRYKMLLNKEKNKSLQLFELTMQFGTVLSLYEEDIELNNNQEKDN